MTELNGEREQGVSALAEQVLVETTLYRVLGHYPKGGTMQRHLEELRGKVVAMDLALNEGLTNCGLEGLAVPDQPLLPMLEKIQCLAFRAKELHAIDEAACVAVIEAACALPLPQLPLGAGHTGMGFVRAASVMLEQADKGLSAFCQEAHGWVVELLFFKAQAFGYGVSIPWVESLSDVQKRDLLRFLKVKSGDPMDAPTSPPAFLAEAALKFATGGEWCTACKGAWAMEDGTGLCPCCAEVDNDVPVCGGCGDQVLDGCQTFEGVKGVYCLRCDVPPGFVPKFGKHAPPAPVEAPTT